MAWQGAGLRELGAAAVTTLLLVMTGSHYVTLASLELTNLDQAGLGHTRGLSASASCVWIKGMCLPYLAPIACLTQGGSLKRLLSSGYGRFQPYFDREVLEGPLLASAPPHRTWKTVSEQAQEDA